MILYCWLQDFRDVQAEVFSRQVQIQFGVQEEDQEITVQRREFQLRGETSGRMEFEKRRDFRVNFIEFLYLRGEQRRSILRRSLRRRGGIGWRCYFMVMVVVFWRVIVGLDSVGCFWEVMCFGINFFILLGGCWWQFVVFCLYIW